MDAVLLLVGGGTTSVGVAVGFALGRVARVARPRRYRCACGHALSFHDPKLDSCQHVRHTIVDSTKIRCGCRRYVGERPPPEFDPDDVLRQLRGDA